MTGLDIGNVNCCWGNPDEIYFTVEGSNKVYNVDLRDEWYAFPIGIWDGHLIIGNEDSCTNGMMHDEVLDFYVFNEGWPPLNIAPAKEKYDQYDYADEQVIYDDIDDYPEYYYEPVELDDDGYWYDEDGNQYEEEDYEYRKLKPEYQMTYGELLHNLGSPEARGRFFVGRVPLEGYNESYFDFVCFWDDPDKDDAKSIMREIGNPYYVVFGDEKEAREYYKTHKVPTLEDYIDGKIGVEVKKDEEAFALHLMKPEDKWNNTSQYRRNRDEVINIPMERAAGTIARYNALKNMYGESRSIKRINMLESQMRLINEAPNVAGTDEPYYKDPDTGFVIKGENGDPDACPFGYFQYKYGSNDLKLFTCWDCEDAIDSDSLLHGDIAREVTYIIVNDLMYRIIIPHEEEILRSLYDLINKGFVNEHNLCDMVRKAFSDAGVDYEPNDDFISFLKEDIKDYEWSELLEYGGLFEDVYSHIGEAYDNYGDYDVYGSVFGVSTNEIIHNSRLLGRVWVDKGLITFYPGQQPSRDEMKYLLKDLSKNIRVEYDKFLDFYIIFETGGRNGYKGNGYHGDPTAEIKCCKVSEYIEGKYDGFNRDEEIEMVKNRKGVEKLNIHLAKPEDKKEFFKNFRKTRDKALYSPMERAAGTIARYNALKNMYGENRNLKRVNILESQLMLLTEASLEDIYSKYYSDIPWEMFNEIVNLDPTASNGRMGRYGKWLLNIYKKGTFKEGDFGEARELLPVYDKYRNVIEVKDIMKLNSMGELYQVVQPYMGGDKATSKSDAARKIKNGAEKVYEDNQWVIVIPHTREAAQLYGKHTRWCTAAERSDNMFDHYNDKGPLYVNIDKVNDRKYQFHFQSPLSEGFMDEMDKPLYDKVSKDESIADYIGMTDGAKEYYARAIGKKSGIIVLSETEDLQQANISFNRSDGSVIDAIDAFDSVTEPYHNLELRKENIGEGANKYGTYIVSKHGKKNAINGGRVVSDKWFDYVTLVSKNIIEVVDGLTWNSRRRRLMFVNDGTYVLGNKVWQSSSHVSYDEKFISADYKLFMRTNDGHYTPITEGANLESINYRSMDNERVAYIECSDIDFGSYFDIFVSKKDGTVITVDTLEKEFINFIEKNCLEIIYDYESGNQTGAKEHPYNVIIPMFEEDVLNCEGYKLSSTSMRNVMQNSYLNWLHYAEDYGGLLGNDEQ